jgi:hypothetical protein
LVNEQRMHPLPRGEREILLRDNIPKYVYIVSICSVKEKERAPVPLS